MINKRINKNYIKLYKINRKNIYTCVHAKKKKKIK